MRSERRQGPLATTLFTFVNLSIVVLLNHVDERICTYGPVDGTSIALPTMDAGYRILLRSAAKARSPRFLRPIHIRPLSLRNPEDTQLSERSALNPDVEVMMAHKSGLSHTANKVKGKATKATPSEQTVQALLLPLLVLLFLVPGFLLFVEHVRNGNNYNGRTSWRDQDPSTMSLNGESPQASLNVVDSGPLQPAVIAAEDPAEVAKCEGWRDWVDYGVGWKGCTP